MRLRHPDGQQLHLSYGTHVHPADTLADLLADLDRYAVPVREQLGVQVLALSLGLPAPLAAALASSGKARVRLRAELDGRGLEVVSLNGVTLGSLRGPAVKDAAYQPDWTSDDRLDYTLDLARVLVDLLPDDAVRGSVSTVGLGWGQHWSPERTGAAVRVLDRLAGGLAEIAWQTGRAVRVGFLPEPGCALDSTVEAAELLAGVDSDRLGICLDLGHLGCSWEAPAEALGRLAAAGLPVVRVQLATALECADPVAAELTLRGYTGDRFLHQTRSAAGGGADDLPAALDAALPGPWRVRYPLPLPPVAPAPLTSTVEVLRDALGRLFGGRTPACDHLDVETYTWPVLPAGQRPTGPAELAAGIARELAFACHELTALGVTPVSPVACR